MRRLSTLIAAARPRAAGDHPLRRARQSVLAALVLLASLPLLGCGGSNTSPTPHPPPSARSSPPQSRPSLSLSSGGASVGSSRPHGQFAGYLWSGPVVAVAGAWVVPRIVGGSHGSAATWIGAQARGKNPAFVQIGVNERNLADVPHRRGSYITFWSDAAEHFHPQSLFVVHGGDRMSATLELEHGRWMLRILDVTSGLAARLSTRAEAHEYDIAAWLQEDVTDEALRAPAVYPRLTPVVFRRLAVNGSSPAYAALYSQWLFANGIEDAPSPLDGDAFVVGPASLTAAGARYLEIAGQDDLATETFDAATAGWGPDTASGEIEAAREAFAGAIAANVKALSSSTWPSRVQPLIASLIAGTRAQLRVAQSSALHAPGGIADWRVAITRASRAIAPAGHEVRRALHVPELAPGVQLETLREAGAR